MSNSLISCARPHSTAWSGDMYMSLIFRSKICLSFSFVRSVRIASIRFSSRTRLSRMSVRRMTFPVTPFVEPWIRQTECLLTSRLFAATKIIEAIEPTKLVLNACTSIGNALMKLYSPIPGLIPPPLEVMHRLILDAPLYFALTSSCWIRLTDLSLISPEYPMKNSIVRPKFAGKRWGEGSLSSPYSFLAEQQGLDSSHGFDQICPRHFHFELQRKHDYSSCALGSASQALLRDGFGRFAITRHGGAATPLRGDSRFSGLHDGSRRHRGM